MLLIGGFDDGCGVKRHYMRKPIQYVRSFKCCTIILGHMMKQLPMVQIEGRSAPFSGWRLLVQSFLPKNENFVFLGPRITYTDHTYCHGDIIRSVAQRAATKNISALKSNPVFGPHMLVFFGNYVLFFNIILNVDFN
uniref:Uncharacterized protein n=1 Tax=Glossina brevipalpis TaxID=37001 RepID=A0A1A9W085_9MUSC